MKREWNAFLLTALHYAIPHFLFGLFLSKKTSAHFQLNFRFMNKTIRQRGKSRAENKLVNVIVETPKGSRFKFAYTPGIGLLRVKCALPPGKVFPFNSGFIPSTFDDEGHPLDILILNDEPVIAGCLLKAQLLGVVYGEQTENGKTLRHDRLVGEIMYEESSPEFRHVELDEDRIAQIEFLFEIYNNLSGKDFKVLGIGNSRQAGQLICQSANLFPANGARN